MQGRQNKRGIAAVEFAMMLPVMALILFLLVEGAHAMHAYSNLVEASREGARMALMEGTTSDIVSLIQSITDELDADAMSTSVVTDAGAKTVTVEVAYAYQPFSENAFEMLTGDSSFTIVAQTTMPLP